MAEAGRVQRHHGERIARPDRAVGKVDFLDAEHRRVARARGRADRDLVAGAGDRESHIRSVLEHADIGSDDPGAEGELVDALRVDDLVLAVAEVEQIGVVAGSALEQVVALAAGDRVVAGEPSKVSLPSPPLSGATGANVVLSAVTAVTALGSTACRLTFVSSANP